MSPPRPLFPVFALASLIGEASGAVRQPASGTFPETEAAVAAKRYDDALARSAWDEAVKALFLKLRLETGKLDDAEGAFLRELAKAADTAPEPMRAPLRALLARQFAAYRDRHRWELRNRTAGGSGDRIEGWDGPRLLKETDARFQAALADAPALLATPIAAYAAITDRTSSAAGDARRPTLFDFLAYDALEHYTRRDRYDEEPGDSPVFAADSPLTGDTAAFLAWRPAGDDAPARAVSILQRLLRAHADAPEAFAEAELERLRWARRATSGDDGRAAYPESTDSPRGQISRHGRRAGRARGTRRNAPRRR